MTIEPNDIENIKLNQEEVNLAIQDEIKEQGEGDVMDEIVTSAGAERLLEVYFKNYQLNLNNKDISFDVTFNAFFEDGTPMMQRQLKFGWEHSLNKVLHYFYTG